MKKIPDGQNDLQNIDAPTERMWQTIEGYGIKRSMLERSHATNSEILRLYQMIRKKKSLRADAEMVKRLTEYVEKLKNKTK